MLTVTPKYLDATTIVLSTIHSEQVDKLLHCRADSDSHKAVDSHKAADCHKAFKAATQPLKYHSFSHSKVSDPLDPLLGKLRKLFLSGMQTPDLRGLRVQELDR